MALERIGKRSLWALRADLDLVGGVILIFIHHSTGFRWSQDPTNRILVLPLDPIRTTRSDAIVLLEGTWIANPRFFLYFDPMLDLPRLCRMILATVSVCLGVCAEEAMKLDAHLESLRPLLGKVWRAEFKNPASDKPVVDVAHWERALNGKAVRITHSINDGAYGGESIVMWDDQKKSLQYHYFTTAGFTTVGTMTIEGNVLVSRETVTGNKEGITEVRGRHEIRADGTLFVKTEYLKGGEWIPGREAHYKEAPGTTVKFR